MYVDTAGANGWPFYGYAAAGTAVAWTYVDGSDGGKWKLSVGGIDSLAVTPGGNVGIGTTSPSAMLHVSGPVQIGSGTGSAEPPDKPIIIRRVKSTINTAGSVVARTDKLSLERDGSNGGWRIANVASPGSTTIAATGLTSTGGTVNFVNFLNGNSEAGITTIFSESQSIASFRCTFGDTATPGHLTEVSLIRGVNNYWTGTMTSTFNQ